MTPDELRAALKRHRLTSAAFARRCGLSNATLTRWKSGNTPVPGWVPAYFDVLDALDRIKQAANLE